MRTMMNALRLRLESGLSERQTARSLGVPRSTMQDYLARFRASGLSWPLPAAVDEAALERALFTCDVRLPTLIRSVPDWALMACEKKRKGVTLYLLWQEFGGSTTIERQLSSSTNNARENDQCRPSSRGL